MQIIVDSGATKATWIILLNQKIERKITTPGISPLHLSELATLDLFQLHLADYQMRPAQIFFYGTGCGSNQQQDDMRQRLRRFFHAATHIEVHSDLLGTARSLLKKQKGIAAILGTGSNSCYYDGQQIIHNWGGNGYILGDEGSGATLGKRLLNAYLTQQLPPDLRTLFDNEFKLTRGDILQKVYREPLASRYLGSFVPFLATYRNHDFVQTLLQKHFVEFIETNIKIYPNWEYLPVGISGSIGYYFQTEIKAAAIQQIDFQTFIKNPVDGLVDYHLHDDN